MSSLDQMRASIDFAKGELGARKRIISTEFSLKNYFKTQLRKRIDAGFTVRWHLDPSWLVWQYLNAALNSPRPQDEWLDFLRGSPWFVAVGTSLTDADESFDRDGLVAATFAMCQTQPEIGPDTDP